MLRYTLLPLLVVLSLAAVPARAEDKPAPEKPLIFGLQRTVSGDKAQAEAAALEGYLSEALKHPVKAQIFATYDELALALSKSTVDMAWINPIPFVRATQSQPGIQAVAKAIRSGAATYKAVIFVKAGSSAKTLADLKGTAAGWVDKESSAGYLYPRLMFIKSGATSPDTYFGSEKFLGTHAAVCQAVLSGDVFFGATFESGGDNTDLRADGCTISLGDAAKDKFRAIAASDPIPNEVVAVRPGFSPDLSDALGSVFGQMSQTEAGRKVLTDVFSAEGFGATLETDFDSVRAVIKAVGNAKSPAAVPASDEPKPEKHKKKTKPKTDE